MVYRRSLAIFGSFFLCCCLRGQIVNIEDRRFTRDTTGWFGQLDLGGQWTRNVNAVLTVNGIFRLDRVSKQQNWLLLADYRMVRAEGSNFLNAGFGHLRQGIRINDRWQWENFTQVQYDEKLRLNLRWLIGTGLRWQLVDGKIGRAFLGTLYMFEYDELRNFDLKFRDHRLSSYLSMFLQLSPTTGLSNTTYYQPRLPDFNQTRISSATTLTVGISKKLSFTSRFNLTHDARINRVFPELPKTTYVWTNGLRLAW